MIHLLDKNVLCACCTSETILGSGNRKANEAQMLGSDWQIQRSKSLQHSWMGGPARIGPECCGNKKGASLPASAVKEDLGVCYEA